MVWHIYSIAAIRSMGGAFHHPAMISSTSLMVPEKHLARIGGANQTLQGLISIFAPPLGALLLELFSTQNVLLIDIGTAIFAILTLLFIPSPQPPRQTLQADGVVEKTSYLHDLREGFDYVVRWKGLLGLILIAMILNFLLIPSSSFLPLVITKIFNGGSTELGWVESGVRHWWEHRSPLQNESAPPAASPMRPTIAPPHASWPRPTPPRYRWRCAGSCC